MYDHAKLFIIGCELQFFLLACKFLKADQLHLANVHMSIDLYQILYNDSTTMNAVKFAAF